VAYPDSGDNGTATAASIVTAPDGLARFTVLTDRVIRMESLHFSDAPSLAFINRQLPTPAFTNTPNSTHCVVIKTARIELAYACASGTNGSDCMGSCAVEHGTDVHGGTRSPTHPAGLTVTEVECCAACAADTHCAGFLTVKPGTPISAKGKNCWPMAGWQQTEASANRTLYTAGGAPVPGAFTPANLRAVIQLTGSSRTVGWMPGQDAGGNLLGTISSWNENIPARTWCDVGGISGTSSSGVAGTPANHTDGPSLGPLSRDGWAVLDDSDSPLFDREVRLPPPAAPGTDPAAAQWPWAEPNPKSRTGNTGGAKGGAKGEDLYLFGCGDAEYTECLGDLSALSGQIALPARSVLGVWWSHYEALSQQVFVDDVLTHYAAEDIPLNHVVLDCDWHVRPKGKKLCGGFGGKPTPYPPQYLTAHAILTCPTARLTPRTRFHMEREPVPEPLSVRARPAVRRRRQQPDGAAVEDRAEHPLLQGRRPLPGPVPGSREGHPLPDGAGA
jgi:hypothetical protein